MTGVRISERLGLGIVHRVEERGVAIVGRIPEKMLVQQRDDFGSSGMRLERGGAAQRGLKAGHQKRSENSLPADVRERDADASGSERNEIVIVAADSASGAADGCQLKSGQRRDRMREKLLLHLRGRFRLRSPGAGARAVLRSARRSNWSSR